MGLRAPVAVAQAAGLHASRIDGSKLAYNQEHPSLPDILICLATLAGPLLGAIGSLPAPASEPQASTSHVSQFPIVRSFPR